MTAPATHLQVWCSECRDYCGYNAQGWCPVCGETRPCSVTRTPRVASPTATCNACGAAVRDMHYTCAECGEPVGGEPVPKLVHEDLQQDFAADLGIADADDEPLSDHVRDKLRILRAHRWHCYYCGLHQRELTPMGLVLDVDWQNYVAACTECLLAIRGRAVQQAMVFEDETQTHTDAA